MIKKLVHRPDSALSVELGNDLHPVLQRIYVARGIRSANELECTLNHLLPVNDLKGMAQAVEVICDAIRHNEKILIVADFDCDGATSCAVAVQGLRALGAKSVQYLVPNRFEYGYGLTPEIVDVASQYEPDVLITVDNGISSIQGVARARQLGMKVVVTDHHLQGATLPDAHAIVNPNQHGDQFASKNLAGVGVIFYVLLACRVRLRDLQWFQASDEPNLAVLLDLVALGTVADLVPLDANNRVLVEQGLRRIRAGKACAGIEALLQVSGRHRERVVASDMGFALGPRLNAAGRLEDMSIGIECLLSESPERASELAVQLESLNQERKQIESEMREQAFSILDKIQLDSENKQVPVAICLFDKAWHQGVIGILASRIKERFYRPVIIFAQGEEGEIKGSARSIPGVHIRDVLDAIATRYDNLITTFGGHAMAAGLSIQSDKLEQFSTAFRTEILRWVDEDDLQGRIHTDGVLETCDYNLELAELLRHAGPWGQGFPEPLFEGEFKVIQQRIVGERHLKMLVQPLKTSMTIDAIVFNAIDNACPENKQSVRLAYKLDVNEFRGQKSLQLMVEHLELMDV